MARARKKRDKAEKPEGTDGPIYREVEAPVDAGEMLATFKKFADEEQNVDNLVAELDAQRKALAAAKKDREAAKRSALHLARTGKGLARVEVVEVVDEARGVVRLVRKDDPSVEVDTRALTAGEIQALGVARPAEVAQILGQVAKRGEGGGVFDFDESEPPPPAIDPAAIAELQRPAQH